MASGDLSALGDLVVQVGGDISPLQDALNQVPDAVNKAAAAVDEFFATPPSDAVTQAASGVADSIGQAGAAAAGAVPPMNDLANQVQNTGRSISDLIPPTQQAAEATGNLGMQMFGLYAAVGLIRGVVDTLKSFAEEAVTAFGTLQRAQISLTELTGSAEGTTAAIEQLRQMANQQGLDFPQLLQADQRMVALGFDASQIPGALRAIADAAAATDRPFQATATAFERIAESGAVMPRTLATLGLSLNDIARAMGVASDQATAMFKTLDQSERLTVLETAFQKYAGVAELAAQGVLGQWQTLKNELTKVMQDIGAALAPTAQAFITFFRDQVIPLIENAIAAFRALPTPVQEAIVGLTALAAILVPLAAGLALAVNVVVRLTGSIGSLVEAIGGMETIATVGAVLAGVAATVTAAIVLWTQLRDIWKDLQAIIPGLGGSIQSLVGPVTDVVMQITGLRDVMNLLQDAVHNFQTAFSALGPAVLNIATGPFGALKQVLNDTLLLMGKIPAMTDAVTQAVQKQTSAVQAYNENMAKAALAVQQGTMSLGAYAAAHDKALESLMMANAAEIQHATQLRNTSDAYKELQNAVDSARQHLAIVQEAYAAGTASAGQLAAAQKALDTAIVAINPSYITAADYQKMLLDSSKQLDQANTTLAQMFRALVQPAVMDLATAQQNLANAQDNLRQKLIAVQLAQAGVTAAQQLGRDGAQQLIIAENALTEAKKLGLVAAEGVKEAEKDLTASRKDADTVSKSLAAASKAYQEALLLLNPAEKTVADTEAALQVARKNLESDTQTLLATTRTFLALPDNNTQRAQAAKDMDAAEKALVVSEKAYQVALTDTTKAKQSDLALTNLLNSVQKDTDALVKDHILPNTLDLTTVTNQLRAAKEAVLAAYQIEQQRLAEVNLLVQQGKQGTQEYTTATNNLKEAQSNLHTAQTQVNDITSVLTGTFKVNKQALDEITVTDNATKVATQNLQVAFSALGLAIPSVLQQAAKDADVAFQAITASGMANSVQLREAEIADLQKWEAYYKSIGQQLGYDQQDTLNKLLAQQELYNIQTKDLLQNWYGAWSDTIKQINQAFTRDLGQAFTDLITNIGNVGADFKKLGDDIVSIVVNHIIAEAIKPLLSAMDSVLGSIIGGGSSGVGLIGGLGQMQTAGTGCFGALVSGISPVQTGMVDLNGAVDAIAPTLTDLGNVSTTTFGDMASMMDQATGGMTNLASATDSVGSSLESVTQSLGGVSGDIGAGLSGAISGVMGVVSGIVGMVSGIITAIASIIQVVQGFHEIDLLKSIELNTRQTHDVLRDSVFHDEEVYYPYLFALYQITGATLIPAVKDLRGILENALTAEGRSENLLNEIKADLDKMVRGVDVTGNVSTSQADSLSVVKEQLLGIWADTNEIKGDIHDYLRPAIETIANASLIMAGGALGGQLGAEAALQQEQVAALQAAAKAAQSHADALNKIVETLQKQVNNEQDKIKQDQLKLQNDQAEVAKRQNDVTQQEGLVSGLQDAVSQAFAQYQQTGTPTAYQNYQEALQKLDNALNALKEMQTIAANAQQAYTIEKQIAQQDQTNLTTLQSQLTAQMTAAAKATDAATAAQSAAASALAILAQIEVELKAGGGQSTGGGGGIAGNVAQLAQFISSNFSTLFTWLSAAFRPLLIPSGSLNQLNIPQLPVFSGGPAGPTSPQQSSLTLVNNFNGPVYGGQNAMQQMTRDMADTMIAQFRRAGMKF